ncbi:hypothetical protein [Paenibacillus abyssi]|uniref:Uncharacterized protein n=1 Tax=Paenibacillus abyssi TaxID=1340531 RepID=A0A917CMW6_9BACL|nr:hypothetical protein [Paenibacillus abyssi]GGF91483.1 hypothetical protein GCM10010916_05980 [Paenibacillus abyssi]
MKIYMLNEVWEYENSQEQIDFIVDRIQTFLNQSRVIIEQILIDGEELDGNFTDFLAGHIDGVNKVDIKVVKESEWLTQMLESSTHYISRALPELTKLSDQLYTGLDVNVWSSINDFTEGLQHITILVQSLSGYMLSDGNAGGSEAFLSQLNGNLGQFMNAALDKDHTLMADLLNYEIKPQLEQLLHQLNQIMISEE